MPTLVQVRQSAIDECAHSLISVHNANELFNGKAASNGVVFSDDLCNSIIDRAFLKIFEAFEAFLEQIFICYMLDEAGINGKKVDKYVSPVSAVHAENFLCGMRNYTDFTSRETIIRLASNCFDNVGPFIYLNSITQDFEDMKKIRNAISHFSLRSKRDFENLVRSRISYLPANTCTASFLNTMMPRKRQTFFVHYHDVLIGAIEAISNP